LLSEIFAEADLEAEPLRLLGLIAKFCFAELSNVVADRRLRLEMS
jgi:hypothetical protein